MSETTTPAAGMTADGKRLKKRYMYRGVELTGHPANATDHQVQMFHCQQFPELINAKSVLHPGGVRESETARLETYDMVVDVPHKAIGGGTGVVSGTGGGDVVEFKKSTGTKG